MIRLLDMSSVPRKDYSGQRRTLRQGESDRREVIVTSIFRRYSENDIDIQTPKPETIVLLDLLKPKGWLHRSSLSYLL